MRVFIGALVIGTCSMWAYCQQPPKPLDAPTVVPQSQPDDVPKITAEKTMSFWMAKKLEFSKAILESLTKGDFETMSQTAEQMQRLGKIEGFVRRNKNYRTQLHTFELANQELVRQSSRKNVEGATLAFNQLTTSCVACHTMLREGIE